MLQAANERHARDRPRSRVTVTHCQDEPEAVDEIKSAMCDVHIERMNDGAYWMRIGDREFDASTLKRGKLIITERK
jgi:hypothetical protein